jgi:hypothetical protein
MFLKSFILFYKDRLCDLIVQVQVENSNYTFYEVYQKKMESIYGCTFQLEPFQTLNQRIIHNNRWAHMIYKSLQYDEVISMDDDVIFIKSGLFDYIDTIKHKSNILSFRYSTSKEHIINSAFMYKRDVDITEEDFLSLEDVGEYEGVDTGLMYHNHKSDCKFLDSWIKTQYHDSFKNCILTEYFIHLGNISCDYNIILGEVNG